MSRTNRTRAACALLFAALLLAVPACERVPEDDSPFRKKPTDYAVAFVVDQSRSFEDVLDEAWRYLTRVIAELFRGREAGNGYHDVIVLAQISGSPNSILWTGTPEQFRTKFKTAAEFKQLYQGLDPNSSRVHSALADTLNHVTRLKAKRSLIVGLTDMVDNEPGSLPKLQEALRRYGKDGKAGNVALYWVEPGLVAAWENRLSVAVKHHEVTNKRETPDLPRFDD